MRAAGREMTTHLSPPRKMSLDEAIEYLGDEDLLEVTPENYRIRKRILDTNERGKYTKQVKEDVVRV